MKAFQLAYRAAGMVGLLVGILQLPLWSPLLAQTGAGAIQGTVKDPSGAAIPAAKIKIVHATTSTVREAETNEVGFYTFPAAQIGHYEFTVQSPGMMTWKADLEVITGQTSTLDVALQVGSSATEVTVAGSATSLVVDTSPTVAEVVEQSRIEQLPMNGRDINTLMNATTPGAEDTRINGMMGAALEVVQDGTVLRNLDTASISGRPPGLDTVQEFRVETSVSSARFDRPATAILSSKSGTNGVHGSAFETARNSSIGVARRRQDFFSKAPHLVRNEFGASVGGPVILPKIYHGRNKTFFFVAYEGLRLSQAQTAPTTVFPNAWRQGDFSGVTDSLGRKLTIYDPWSTQSQANRWARTPYVNNQIPMAKQSPFAKYLYGVTPVATQSDINPAFSNNFFGTASNASTQNTTSFKIDHWISERDRFFARYSFGTSSSAGPPTSSQGAATTDLSTNITYRQSHDKSMSLSWTHTFSPSFFSETFAGVSYTNYDIYTGDFYRDWSGQLGLPNPFGSSGFPNVTGTGVNMTFVQGDTRRQNKSLIYNIDQNFTKIAGKHEVQFGGKFRMDRANVLPDQQYASGLFDFASNGTGLYDPTSGSSYSATPQSNFTGADFFLGLASSYRNQLNPKAYHFSAGERAVYVQDNWRVRPSLTLTLGMRYAYNPPFKDKVGLLQSFDLKNMAIVDTATMDQLYQAQRTTPAVVNSFTSLGVKFETPGEAGMSPGLINPYKTNFGPRAGFAWRSFGGRRPLVIRGGLGMYDYSPPLRDFNASTRSNPPFNAAFSTNYINAASSPDGLTNYLLRSVPTVVAGVNSANAVNPNSPGAVTPGSFTVVFFDPNYPDTRVADWNVSLEREVISQTYARVTYAGTHGWNLNQDHMMNESPNAYIWYMTTGLPTASGTYANTAERPLNQTTYGNLEEYAKTGWSNSNSLQLQLQRRASRGVAFQVFYTLNNAFRAGGNGWHDGIVSDPNVYLPGAVPTDFDARNRLLYYSRDTAIPKHRIRWNWLIDVPVGKGKKFAQNAGPKLNRAIGGWQLAGIGSWRSRYFTLPTTNYGSFGPVETYGLQYPVQDCRSGQCIAGYLYWNGYLQANQINTYNAAGQCTGICGVPANYKPSNSPVIPYPATPIPNDPAAPYYGTNTVYVPMKSGAPQRTTINTNLHPWQNQFVMGPGSFALDASLFKVVPIKERLMFRLQADFFSVLNNPGMGTPGSNGIISLQNSSNSARVMQLNGRLTW